MRLSIRSAAALVAASLSFGFVASAARADFVFSNQRSTVTIGGTNYDRVTIYAKNDGTGYTLGGSKLQGMDMTLTSSGAMRFETGHMPDTAVPSADGKTMNLFETDLGTDIDLNASTADIAGGNLLATKLLAECFSDANLALFGTTPKSNSGGNFNAVAAYANVTSLHAVGIALSTAAAVPAGTGSGAAIATILTTPGATVTITGQIGGDTGGVGTVNPVEVILPEGTSAPAAAAAADVYRAYAYTAVAPEPTTLAAVALLAPLARRRRRSAVGC